MPANVRPQRRPEPEEIAGIHDRDPPTRTQLQKEPEERTGRFLMAACLLEDRTAPVEGPITFELAAAAASGQLLGAFDHQKHVVPWVRLVRRGQADSFPDPDEVGPADSSCTDWMVAG